MLRCGASRSVDFSDGEADLGAKLAFIGSPFPVIGSAIGPPAPAGWADLAPCRVKRLSETASRSCPPEMLWLERGRRPSRERASSKHPGNKKTFVNQFFNFYRRLAGYTGKSSTKLEKILNDISCLSREVAYSPARRQHDSSRKMIQGNSSYRDYGVSEGANFDGDRLPVGPALFAVFGLSLLGWAVILVPFVAILHH
ncbi:MAG: hypothetical protein E6G83_09390 [Alphaproteobacteria bacterium]|nr:MAG: hypothetical protein E6G83_09390 [Alphaproteobacteria bacterium]